MTATARAMGPAACGDVTATTLLRRRLDGTHVVDEWGADPDLVDLLDPAIRVALRVEVLGTGELPAEGPAVLVANRRLGLLEPFVVLQGIRRSTGRRARFVGIPDVAPIGPALRRFGGALGHPAEVRGLLRAGHLCLVPLARQVRAFRAGRLSPEALAPAVELGVPVVPVAVAGNEITNRWRVIVGEPILTEATGSPLALADAADRARAGVQELLDEAFPPRWPFG